MKPRQRQLTTAEIRFLRARSSSLRRRGIRGLSSGLWIGIAAIGALWALTMLASDAPALVITAFWLAVGAVILMWVRKSFRADQREFDTIADGLESAIRKNLALVYEVQATGFLEFEEIEDEGACYAFQLWGKDEIVFLSGQQFYAQARFPSLDFALVFPLDEAGGRVDMLVEKHGPKTKPERLVPASVKRMLTIPEDLGIIAGTLDDLEERLRRGKGASPDSALHA
jgi:hypothetical protein